MPRCITEKISFKVYNHKVTFKKFIPQGLFRIHAFLIFYSAEQIYSASFIIRRTNAVVIKTKPSSSTSYLQNVFWWKMKLRKMKTFTSFSLSGTLSFKRFICTSCFLIQVPYWKDITSEIPELVCSVLCHISIDRKSSFE